MGIRGIDEDRVVLRLRNLAAPPGDMIYQGAQRR